MRREKKKWDGQGKSKKSWGHGGGDERWIGRKGRWHGSEEMSNPNDAANEGKNESIPATRGHNNRIPSKIHVSGSHKIYKTDGDSKFSENFFEI